MPKLLTIEDLCELFDIKRRTLYDWLQQGKLPQPIRRFGAPRWNEEEIAKLIRKEGSGAPEKRAG